MKPKKKLTKKKKIILISSISGVVLIAAGVTTFFVLRNGGRQVNAMAMSMTSHEATVSTGDISNTVVGTGTLADDTAEDVIVPTGITIDEILVESGDTVAAGDPLATVTDASVKSAIVSIQESLTSIEDQLDELEDADDESITVEVDGEEQTIYKNDIEYDKLVAEQADLETALSEMVTLSQTNTITATYSGTIGDINVSEGSEVTKSSTSSSSSSTSGSTSGTTGGMSMTSTSSSKSNSSAGASTAGFTYISTADTTTAVTPTTTVAAAEETNAMLNTASIEEAAADETLNAESDTTTGTEIKGAMTLNVTAPTTGGTPTTAEQLGIPEDAGYTADITWTPSTSTKGTFEAGTQYTATIHLTAKTEEGYYFTSNANELDISISSIANAPYEIKNLGSTANMDTVVLTLAYPATASANDTSTDTSNNTQNSGTNSGSSQNSTNSTESGSAASGTTGSGSTASGSSSGISGSASGSTGSTSGSTSGTASGSTGSTSGTTGSSDSSSTSTDLYSQYEVAGFTISTNENMILSVNVDELDILSIEKGQEVSITLDAVEDETFSGTISSIASSATNSGGVSKYAVEVTLPKTDSMLAGMNASATITISKSEGVLTIPVSALQEQGDKVFVYTSKDDEGNLSGEIEVETGLSDGSNVEITSGLSEGTTVYYTQADTSSSTDDSAETDMKSMMGGGMGGNMSGTMPSGDMPSGGGGMQGGGGAPGQ